MVALVVAAPARLADLAGRLPSTAGLPWRLLCRDKDLTGAVLREIQQHAKVDSVGWHGLWCGVQAARLARFEVPGAVCLVEEEWSPESGLVTAAMKLKRKPLQQFYQTHISRMYGD